MGGVESKLRSSIQGAGSDSQNRIIETITRTISKYPRRVFVCGKCRKQFMIPNARDGSIYRCIDCSAILEIVDSKIVESVESERAEVVIDEAVPQDVQKAIGSEKNIIGRYVVVDGLKAFDVELGRYVALEFLSKEAHLVLDIRVLASLEHKSIARIYDVGVHDGREFVARQFIDGTVRVPEAVLPAFLQVCDAFSYAHGKGVVHGSFNPLNLLFDQEGNPVILNFGIRSSTAAECVAPEVRSGGIPSISSDIFSIAAALESAMLKIPAEVGAIIRKGTSYDPEDRYLSIDGLAADIRNYLDGRPVDAFSRSPLYRMRKVFARHRVASIAAVLVFLMLLGAGAFALQKNREEENMHRQEEKAATAEAEKNKADVEAASEKRRTESLMKALMEYLANAHKEGVERRRSGETFAKLSLIPKRIKESQLYKQVESDARADPRVRYSLGRLYRIIGDEAASEREHEEALKADAQFAKSHYELGVIQYHKYIAVMDRLKDRWYRRAAAAKIKEGVTPDWSTTFEGIDEESIMTKEARELKESATRHFSVAHELLPKDSTEYQTADAVLDHFGPEKQKASKKLLRVLEVLKGFEDAVEILPYLVGPEEGLDRIWEILNAAIEADKGNLVFLKLRGGLKHTYGWVLYTYGQNPVPPYKEALGDFDRLVELNPENCENWSNRGNAHADLALYIDHTGNDPGEEYSKAISDFGKSIEASPEGEYAHVGRGLVYTDWAVYKRTRGMDVTREFENAAKDFDRALQFSKNHEEVLRCRGMMWIDRGVFEAESGKDPRLYYSKGKADLAVVLETDSKDGESWSMHATALVNTGNYVAESGGDPSAEYSEAYNDFKIAVSLTKNPYDELIKKAQLMTNWAKYLKSVQKDPMEKFSEALKDMEQAIKYNPKIFDAWYRKGLVLNDYGTHMQDMDKDPTDVYRESIQCLTTAISLNESSFHTWIARGLAWNDVGVWKENHKQNPLDDYRKALADFERAVKLNSENFDTWLKCAMERANIADVMITAGKDPSDLLAKAQEELQRASALNPVDYAVWQTGANIQFSVAMLHEMKGEYSQATKCFTSAAESYERAIKTCPILEEDLRQWVNKAKRKAEEMKGKTEY